MPRSSGPIQNELCVLFSLFFLFVCFVYAFFVLKEEGERELRITSWVTGGGEIWEELREEK